MAEWVNVGWVNVGLVNDGVGKCLGILPLLIFLCLSNSFPFVFLPTYLTYSLNIQPANLDSVMWVLTPILLSK